MENIMNKLTYSMFMRIGKNILVGMFTLSIIVVLAIQIMIISITAGYDMSFFKSVLAVFPILILFAIIGHGVVSIYNFIIFLKSNKG